MAHQGGAHPAAVGVGHALLGNAGVVFDLPLDDGADIVQLNGVGKFQNVRQVQRVQVAVVLVGHLFHFLVEQALAVPLDAHHVGVLVPDFGQGGVAVAGDLHNDVQAGGGVQQLHGANALGQHLAGGLQVGGANLAQHLQAQRGVARQRAQHGAGVDAAHVAGGGHDHALGVLDNVAAAFYHQAAGLLAQHLAGLGRRQRDGDGLGAAQRGHQLAGEDSNIGIVNSTVKHFVLRSFLSSGLHVAPIRPAGCCAAGVGKKHVR